MRKRLTYIWAWEYDPIISDVDKVAMAWSDDFDCMSESVKWEYTMHGNGYKRTLIGWQPTGDTRAYTYSKKGYDDITPACGVGKDIDIKDWFEWDDTPRYFIYKHSGTLSAEISRYYSGKQEQASVVARYYHHTITWGSSTLSFTNSPSISLQGSYDKAPDSAREFTYYK